MELTDLSKDAQRFLLEHWTLKEINDSLFDPEYFFEQVVIPRTAYLRRLGQDVPVVRIKKTPMGELRLLIHS